VLKAYGSGMQRDFVGLQVLCRESGRRWMVLFPDAGRSCPGCWGLRRSCRRWPAGSWPVAACRRAGERAQAMIPVCDDQERSGARACPGRR
jgi:hypothetical protein